MYAHSPCVNESVSEHTEVDPWTSDIISLLYLKLQKIQSSFSILVKELDHQMNSL